MRSLITGGAGFVGSHLSEELLRRGDEVTVLDDLSTGRMDNIDHLKTHPRFTCVIGTIQDRALMADLMDGVDVVYHLAAAVGVRLIIESPVRTLKTNIEGTEIVLDLAARERTKVLIASTSEVYGKANNFPFSEDSDLVMGSTAKSRWSYACSKAIDEFLALAYWKEKKVPVVIARLFNTVGPRQTGRYGMVLPNFVMQACSGWPITVFGSGKQSRCFTWVGEVVRALTDLSHHPDAVAQVVNVGSENEVSIADLAYLVKEMTGSASPVTFIPYDEAYEEGFEDMNRRVPDLTKIRKILGYEPTMPLAKIVGHVIEYYRSRPEDWGRA
jgi:UDP-glucose 4-epimerase